MHAVRLFMTYLLFPLAFTSGLGGAAVAFEAGYGAGTILLTVTLITLLLVVVGEALHPRYAAWGRSHGDVMTDLSHNLVSMVALPRVMDALLAALLLSGATHLAADNDGSLWPSHFPFVVQLLLAMIITQFGEYWVHRLLHEIPYLWRFHAVHHSAPRLYWLNAGRFHPVDAALLYVVAAGPLLLLGAGEKLLLLYTVWASIHGLFQHCNIDLKLGPLNYIFSMAELHRWHHSRDLREANANYGNNIIFWDLVFGSFYFPADRVAGADVGLQDRPDFPQHYLGQLLAPFHWKNIVSNQTDHDS